MDEEFEIKKKEEIAPEAWFERTKSQREFILEKLNELEKPPKEIRTLLRIGNEVFSSEISPVRIFLQKISKEKDVYLKEEIEISHLGCERKLARHLKGGWEYFSVNKIDSEMVRAPEDICARLGEIEKLLKEEKIETIYA